MKVLVTVGTTKFDSLISFLDMALLRYKHVEPIFQIGGGDYKPKNFDYFEFTPDINDYYVSADIVITHAGAGTIYKLLALNKKIFMVPNLERIDFHQMEIAEYMSSKGHAVWCRNFDDILCGLDDIEGISFLPYLKEEFIKFDEITDLILGHDD